MITKGLHAINLAENSSGMCGVMLLLLGCGPWGILPLLLGFRMRVSAAPFAVHVSGGPPAAAHVRDVPSQEAGARISVTPPKPMTSNSKSEGRDSISGLQRTQPEDQLHPTELRVARTGIRSPP